MKFVIFGLTVSSSWGNGHATLWRALCKALAKRGHTIIFFERDVPYYAAHRDVTQLACGELILYPDWASVLPLARRHLADADVAMVTSYCPDGQVASDYILDSRAGLKTFYDLDTPITFARLDAGEEVPYLPRNGFSEFDLVLSYTGGRSLDVLQERLGARRVAPIYGSVDPEAHFPVEAMDVFRGDLTYLGTYAADRQEVLNELLVEPARRLPGLKFVIGGAQYPAEFPWTSNIFFVRHLPPGDHPAFYGSSRITLNVTRAAMAGMGYCPSGRLFEAAACRTAILSDWWEGMDEFFVPGQEILIARSTEEAVQALQLSDAELERIRAAGHEKTLALHTADQRAIDLENALEGARRNTVAANSATLGV
ncbi:MAG TPA: glycosyltransferase [Verrucomicrobiae bacterium]|nr:glycosyltransferase [Verrucomicrobiae bacterium]